MPLRVFVDSDVIISSLISQKGASFLILNQTAGIKLFISNISLQEVKVVAERLSLSEDKLNDLINKHFSIVKLRESIESIKSTFWEYVLDVNDAHIVAGAQKANAHFLISYNTRHFKPDLLKKKCNIILTTPANFLQYLRSV